MIDDIDLRRIAKDTQDAYVRLEIAATERVSTKLARQMKPVFRSSTPSHDGDWSLNLQDALLNERRDNHVPGGLLPMAYDAISYTKAHGTSLKLRGQTLGSHICSLLALYAYDIATKFPAAVDLQELLVEQTRYIDKQITKRFGPPPHQQAQRASIIRHLGKKYGPIT